MLAAVLDFTLACEPLTKRKSDPRLASPVPIMPQNQTIQDAETLALRALAFLAAEPERLEPFLAASGLGPDTLRAASGEAGFLPAVLDHLAGSDDLLLEFAENLGIRPEAVVRARESLAGPASRDFG
jgi:hypothetical protein